MTDPVIAASRAAIAHGSKSFALASRLFDPVLRDRATLLYAWCRHADDVIDGQDGGQGRVAPAASPAASPAARLAELEAGTRAALAGTPPDEPAFAALARFAADTRMPARYPLDLIEGFRIDVEGRPFVTFADTLTYCYHVAGVVGVMMAIAMGVDPADRATLDRACDLGIAFQLDNIARDVVEDAGNGRCYLPQDWLAAAGLSTATFADTAHRAALAGVVRRLVDTAERYEASSRFGTPALPWRAAWAVLAAADIYGGIGRRVRALGP
ncbi:MAG: phytoene/squalene synthase family protein, partial [Janthinobacterium lividum]